MTTETLKQPKHRTLTPPPKLSADELRRLCSYDPDTGVFTRLVATARRNKVGEVMGCDDGRGYLRVTLHGGYYRLHSLAWLHHYGVWPSGEIDHKNGNRSDNRIANLRDVTRAMNAQNRTVTKAKSGFMGVRLDKSSFVARVRHDGRERTIGWFKSAEEAHKAYRAARRALGAEQEE